MSPAAGTTLTTTGVRKSAVLLIQLGREKAAHILHHLPYADVEAVTAEIARLESVTNEETNDVLEEFRAMMTARASLAQGGVEFAQEILQGSIGAERAQRIMERINAQSAQTPFRFLSRVEPAQLRSYIVEEHPQVIALVLAHMTADKASAVLSGMAPEQQASIAHRIATMDRTAPAIIGLVEGVLERRLSSMLQSTETMLVGGVDPLVDIINRSDRSTERQIVAGLESLDPDLAEEIKSRMFMFEDIVTLDDRSMQQVLREVDSNELTLALKGVSDAVRDKITGNLSERAATNLLEEIELLGPVRLTQVEEAQQKVIRAIRQLEEQGQIMLRRGGDDEFVD